MAGPGTFRVVDGTAVEFSEAKAAWATVARPALIGIASKYRETITYKELSEEIQDATGIRTRMLLQHWIGEVLGSVSQDCHRRGEPLLSALCVNAEGSVGNGYAAVIDETHGGPLPADLDMHAAAQRLECCRRFATDVPADGGSPALTKQERDRRRRASPSRPKLGCPNCHLQLPASGVCDTCR